MSVRKKDEQRLRALKAFYKATDGGRSLHLEVEDVAGPAGLTEAETEAAFDYLHDRGYIERQTATHYQLTPFGMDTIEEAERYPDEPVEEFPPMVTLNVSGNVNLTNVGGNMIGSTVQQAGHGSRLTSTTMNTFGDVQAFISALKKELPNLALSDVDCNDLNLDIQTVEAQVQHSTRKKSILIEALTSIRNALLKAASGVATKVAAAEVEKNLPTLIAWSSKLIEAM